MYKFKLLYSSVVSLLLALNIPAASAQIPDSEAAVSYDLTIESMTVTATRQDTDLLKTPIAISAFDMSNQIAGRFEQMTDVAYQIPGLSIGNTGNSAFPEIFIRGVGSSDPSMASDPSIGFYIDDVYVGRGVGMFTDLFDLERIEVIKGPQGSLWGRNTLGGAIHLVTNTPDEDAENLISANLGNFSEAGIGALYSTRLSGNTVGKISFKRRNRDGHTVNVLNNERLSDVDIFSVRGSILYQLSEQSEWLLNSDYTRDRSSSAPFDPLVVGNTVLGISVASPPFSHVEPNGEYIVNNRANAREHRDIYGISAKYTRQTTSYVFSSISAYRTVDFDNIEHNDGLSIQLVEINQLTDQRQFSQEFRLSGSSSDYKWMLGAYYFDERIEDSLAVQSQGFNLLLSPVFGQQNFSSVNNSDIKATNYAIYGNLSYELTNELNFELGVRYSKEYKEFLFGYTNNDVNRILLRDPNVPESLQKDDWSSPSSSFTLSYQPSSDKDSLYYASISRGFRSGGYNTLQSVLDPAFSPEYLTAYQVGNKSMLFNGRVQLDVSGFYYDHEDLQVQTLMPQENGILRLVTTNAAEATEKGFEASIVALLGNSLKLDTSLTILEAQYDSFIDATGQDVSGNFIKLAPKYSGNFGIEYANSLARGLNFDVRLEYIAQSKMYFTESNVSELEQPSYSLINSYLEFSLDQLPSLKATIYGKNLTDKAIAKAGIDFTGILGTVSRVYNPPRTYGLNLELSF